MRSAPLFKLIEDNIEDIFEEQRYKEFLQKVGRFHNYSFYNQLLILMQRPNALKVAGYRAWQKMGRYVKRGEKGIHIIAPRITKVYIDAKDGHTLKKGELSLSELKKAIERKEVLVKNRLYGYIGVTVFDISQTDGRPIHVTIDGLQGTYKELDRLIKVVQNVTQARVKVTDELGMLDAMGYFDPSTNEIVVRKLSDVQIAKTLIHEAGHNLVKRLRSTLEFYEGEYGGWKKEGVEMLNLTYDDEEVVVESAAYIVMSQLGIDTSDYSFAYIRNWATAKRSAEDGKKALQSMFSIIAKIADKLLTAIENEFSIQIDSPEEQNTETVQEEEAADLIPIVEANEVHQRVKQTM